MKAVPLELKAANEYVERLHRHHVPVHRDKFRLGAEKNGELVGVIQVARPVSRYLDDGNTLEVVRCCTNGERNACSFLYSRAARITREMGYKKLITYILASEDGASLKASGWHLEESNVGGGSWDTPSRPREQVITQLSLFPSKEEKYPTEKKQRWAIEFCDNERAKESEDI